MSLLDSVRGALALPQTRVELPNGDVVYTTMVVDHGTPEQSVGGCSDCLPVGYNRGIPIYDRWRGPLDYVKGEIYNHKRDTGHTRTYYSAPGFSTTGNLDGWPGFP